MTEINILDSEFLDIIIYGCFPIFLPFNYSDYYCLFIFFQSSISISLKTQGDADVAEESVINDPRIMAFQTGKFHTSGSHVVDHVVKIGSSNLEDRPTAEHYARVTADQSKQYLQLSYGDEKSPGISPS